MTSKLPTDHPEGASAPHAPSPSYRELERTLVPLPDSSHRPTPAEAAAAEVPRPVHIHATDSEGCAGVRAALAGVEHLDTGDLDVDVSGSTVTLSGSVARRADRDAIVDAVGRMDGVSHVVDHLRIRLD